MEPHKQDLALGVLKSQETRSDEGAKMISRNMMEKEVTGHGQHRGEIPRVNCARQTH